MTVSNSAGSLLDSVLTAQITQQDIQVTVLKKAQDTAKQEGEAVVKMLEESESSPVQGRHLDAYA